MNLTQRQKTGFVIMIGAVIAAAAIQIATGNLFHVTSEEEQTLHTSIVPTQIILLTISITWSYAIPLLACFLAGVYLALRSSTSNGRPKNFA